MSSFGSEKQKRAVAAAERNRVDPTSLDVVLASAVTHASTEVEKAAEGEGGGGGEKRREDMGRRRNHNRSNLFLFFFFPL